MPHRRGAFAKTCPTPTPVYPGTMTKLTSGTQAPPGRRRRLAALIAMAPALLLLATTALGRGSETPPTGPPADPPHERVDEAAFVSYVADLALAERYRAGVPASITAAQAILESNWGRAPIAVAGNNYFGIKCKRYWTGATVLHEDDDYDAEGRLTRSCFRAYDAVADSFADHSDFLRDRERYAALFTYDVRDYEAWAHGLKACGYATDPNYAHKLISIIERLGLAALDARGLAVDDAYDCPPDEE